jgi:hypothetical protein
MHVVFLQPMMRALALFVGGVLLFRNLEEGLLAP